MPIVNFVNEKKEIQVPEGANLRKEAMRAGIQVYPGIHKVLHCPGIAQCGTCRVLITKGIENASPIGFLEKVRLKVSLARIGHEDTMRLSCQTRVMGDMTVETKPPVDWFGENFFS
jgi:ferredoxin